MTTAAFADPRIRIFKQNMRATTVLLISGIAVFALFFIDGFASQADAPGGQAGLQAFEVFGASVSLYLLSKGELGPASRRDWFAGALVLLTASIGFAGVSATLLAVYLFFRDRRDQNALAAGTVAIAVVVQAIWAPLVFSKLSFLLLQVDADVVGWLVGLVVPGSSWQGTVIRVPSGHEVEIYEKCSSFHNLSLASLCWITLSMLHRPYWVKGDIFIGLGAALIQFAFNIWRLVFVCLSLPMYEFWHEGSGKHIFSAVATAFAIVFVQASLVRRDRQHLSSAPPEVIRVSEMSTI
jgi:exosortase/archaeosortase family protein